MPIAWFIGTMNTKTIELSGSCVGQVAMPDLVGALAKPDPVCFSTRTARIEKTEVDGCSVFAEESEIDALSIPRGTKWIGLAGPDAKGGSNRRSRLVSYEN